MSGHDLLFASEALEISISPHRIEVGSLTLATSKISSFRYQKIKPDRKRPMMLLVLGCFSVMLSLTMPIVSDYGIFTGLVFGLTGFLWLQRCHTLYKVFLQLDDRELLLTVVDNKPLLKEIIAALNKTFET